MKIGSPQFILNATANESRFLRLARESISWEYMAGGTHYFEQHREIECIFPFLVVVCTLKGDYICKMGGEGEYHVRDRETLLVPPMVRHTVAVPDRSFLSAAHIRFCFLQNAELLRFFEIPRVVRGRTSREIARIVGELYSVMTRPAGKNEALRQSVQAHRLAFALLDLVLGISKPCEGAGDFMGIERIEPVLTFIEQNLTKPMTKAELASKLFLSEVQFHRVFTALMKMSPMDYVRHARLRKAQLLLLQSGESIGRIGEQVGYPDIFHFSKIFKHTFGMSPLSYRKQLRQWTASPFLR